MSSRRLFSHLVVFPFFVPPLLHCSLACGSVHFLSGASTPQSPSYCAQCPQLASWTCGTKRTDESYEYSPEQFMDIFLPLFERIQIEFSEAYLWNFGAPVDPIWRNFLFPRVVANTFTSSTWETKIEGSWIQRCPGLYSKTLSQNIENTALERWGSELWLLLQTTRPWFPSLIWWLTTTCDSSSRASSSCFWPLRIADMHVEHSPTCRQNTQNNNKIFFKKSWI